MSKKSKSKKPAGAGLAAAGLAAAGMQAGRKPLPKRVGTAQTRTYVRGQKGAALEGTKTAFRRSGLTRREYRARLATA